MILLSAHTKAEISVDNLGRTFDVYANSVKLGLDDVAEELNHDIDVLCRWLSAARPGQTLVSHAHLQKESR